MDNAAKPSKVRAALSRIRKVVDRQPEVPLTEEQLKKLKRHRRNIAITMVIPVFFFGSISLGLDKPMKSDAEPCAGVTSQFQLTEQPVIIPSEDGRSIKGPEGIAMMRSYSIAGQTLDTIPLGYSTANKPSANLRAVPLNEIVKRVDDDADLQPQLNKVRNLAYAIRYNGDIASSILSLTAREGTIATWIAAQRLLGIEADFFSEDKLVSELADSIAGAAGDGSWPFDDVGPGALSSTATIDGDSLHIYVLTTREGFDKDDVANGENLERSVSQAAKNQRITVTYPGGEVRGVTSSNGDVCMSVPWTTGKTLPQLRVTWQMTVPAGTILYNSKEFSTGDRYALMDNAEVTLNAIALPVATQVIWSSTS
ncbi:MAG: hypothetical protein EBX92_03830 [Actinobacteria bacterium]|nr:hypothetical protein [Actinomycetota bacterium]